MPIRNVSKWTAWRKLYVCNVHNVRIFFIQIHSAMMTTPNKNMLLLRLAVVSTSQSHSYSTRAKRKTYTSNVKHEHWAIWAWRYMEWQNETTENHTHDQIKYEHQCGVNYNPALFSLYDMRIIVFSVKSMASYIVMEWWIILNGIEHRIITANEPDEIVL